MNRKAFNELRRLFVSRFFAVDAGSADGGELEAKFYQVLRFLATPGILLTLSLMPTYFALSHHARPGYEWELRTNRLFFAAWSFSATGFATVFEWDTLFPDRLDFLVLTQFPIRMRDIFLAKLAALGLFLSTVVIALNLPSTVLLPLISMGLPGARAAGFLHVFCAHIASTCGAAVFGFLLVAGVQGVLVNLANPRLFRRVSPYVQMVGMGTMILSLLLFPLYSMMMRVLAAEHPGWLAYFPPYWFAGVYEIFVPGPGRLLQELGFLGLKAILVAASVFAASWAVGYRRHYRRTLESEDTSSRRPSQLRLFDRLPRSPEERAVFHFILRTLARSAKHRLFLASYLSVGLSFGILSLVSLSHGVLGISRFGARAFPLLVTFFVVSGYRAAFQFPAELSANWVFQLAETGWAGAARSATRKSVLAVGIAPVLILLLPFEIRFWGAPVGLFHALFGFLCAALLVELLFWRFEYVPFTCAYFPGAFNLAVLAAVYLYGFTNYGFRLAEVETSFEASPGKAAVFVVGAVVALGLSWYRRRGIQPLKFDASVPDLQVLDLS